MMVEPKLKIETDQAELLDVSDRGDGRHRVLKVEHQGEVYILKCYGLKRSRFRTALRQFGSLYLVGKSSISPKARMETEQKTLSLWRREGFDAPKAYGVDAPQYAPCLGMEYVKGPLLSQVFQDPQQPMERKLDLMTRFAKKLCERHARALTLNEPGLLFEHPTFTHVILSNDRFVCFDFEIVFTWKKDLQRLVRREIAGFCRSLVRRASEDQGQSLINAFVAAYPKRSDIERMNQELKQYGSVPVLKILDKLRLFSGVKNNKKNEQLTAFLSKALSLLG